MTELRESAWGHPGRHYAASATRASPFDKQASRRWADALKLASPGICESVERTYKQWNAVLRDYLRTETALRLTVEGFSQSVPVKVDGGMPRPFVEVLRQFEGLEWLLLNRPAMAAVASGTRFMENQVDSVRGKWGEAAGPSGVNEISRVRETAEAWLKKLDELRVVDQIFGTDEDVLGAYYFRIPEIRLYWVVIGITARALGVSVEALTTVVLAHELAHAYTHLGHDIDNERWETERFARSDLDIVEGLAQFYTQVVCKRLEKRMPAALKAYQVLLEKQSSRYKAQLEWVGDDKNSSEIIRVSMIECRSTGLTKSSAFSEAVKRYRIDLRGPKQELDNV